MYTCRDSYLHNKHNNFVEMLHRKNVYVMQRVYHMDK